MRSPRDDPKAERGSRSKNDDKSETGRYSEVQ